MSSSGRQTASRVLQLEEVDSTNAEALRLAAGGERGPLWIIAARQTSGRGRSGRSWIYQPGNLAATLLFDPGCRAADLHQLALLSGAAAHAAIERAAGAPVAGLRLKWPNDILVGIAKTGGILVETTAWNGRLSAVIGMGVNIASAPAIDGRAVTCLGDHAPAVNSGNLIEALRIEMDHWLGVWDAGNGFLRVRQAWLDRAGPPGEALSVNTGERRIDGEFSGIDDTGALLLREADGMVRRLTYGDVSLAGVAVPAAERT